MNKPNIDIPSGFAKNGKKEDFPNDKILNGFDPINPDILPGDCLNKFIDDTYKGLNGVLELYEGCVLYDSTVTYTNKSLVFNITNNEIKFYHSLQNGNINHALTDADYWEEVNLGGSSRNVGEIISSTLPLTDAGLHLLDGSLLQYGIYKEFIDYIADLYAENPSASYWTTEALWQQSVSTYGVCGKFVYDSTNNTVRLPKVTGIIEGTTDISALGDLVEAGLPVHTHTRGTMNITGRVYSGDNGLGPTDAFYTNKESKGPTGNYQNRPVIYFDASRNWTGSTSNPNYAKKINNSTTVQPQTIKAFVYIVVANSTKTSIQVDIDNIATDLNNKADTDLTNTTDSAKVLMSGMAMPSDKYIDLTLGASDSTYTAPANGWFSIWKQAGDPGYKPFLVIINTSSGDLSFETRPGETGDYVALRLSIPAKKGDVIRIVYDAIGPTKIFRFIYAQGSESEVN